MAQVRLDNISKIYKKLENIEIGVSFASGKTESFKNDIDEMQTLLLFMSERMQKKRKFVRKYISALMVEKAQQYPVDFKNVFYQQGNNGFYDLQLLSKISSKKIADLRNLLTSIRSLNDEMEASIEKIISPSVFSSFARKIRVPVMFIEKLNAMRKLHKNRKK